MASLRSTLTIGLRDRVTGPARGVRGAMRGLRRDTDAFGRSQMAIAGGVSRGIRNLALLGAGYVGVSVGIGGAMRDAMDFETAMADVAKKSDLTAHQLGVMENRITDLSNSMPLARTEIAQLVAQAAQFGLANEELERFALLGAKAAVSFDMDPSQTAERLVQLKNALELDLTGLEGLADLINATADSAGSSEQSLIDFMLRMAPTAKQFGVSNEALAAFGASLNEVGINSQIGATGMKAMLNKMSALTDNKDAVDLLDRIGGEGYSERLQRQFFENPIEALEDMMRLTREMNTEQKTGFFQEMFGMEYGDDAAAIANNIDAISRRMDGLADSTSYAGSVQDTYNQFAETTANRLNVLKNNLGNLAAIGGAVALEPIVDLSDRLVDTMGTMGSRVSIFDEIGAGLKGLNTGLGLKPGEGLSTLFENGWSAVFGDTKTFEQDTQNLVHIFRRLENVGTSIRQTGDSIAHFVTRTEDMLGLDSGQIGETLKTIAVWGVGLWAAAAPIRLVAGSIRALAKALFVLSGASMLLGGAKGIRNLFQSLRGAGALAGAAGGAAAGIAATNRPKRRPGARALVATGVAATLGGGTRIEGNETRTTRGLIDDFGDWRRRRQTSGGPDRAIVDVRRQTRAATDSHLMWHGRGLAELSRRTNGGPDGARASIMETRREADGLATDLDRIGSQQVRPQIDTSSIDDAQGKADALYSRLQSISVNFGDIVVANAPGGSPDDLARAIGERTSQAIRSTYADIQ